tara:strand:+ start:119 stop:673 length:555 start_codon:yes stop_codon:yes gene_type:complete
MYPYLRLAKEFFINWSAAKLPALGTHISHHICWPWDLDVWGELNNGRALSLFDLGRYGLGQRTGVITAMRKNNWRFTVAGANVRYRHRITIFKRIEMRTRVIFWDEKFLYFEQVMLFRDGRCAIQTVCRKAVVNDKGIVACSAVLDALDHTEKAPACPEWIEHWIASENDRPWPPALSQSGQHI